MRIKRIITTVLAAFYLGSYSGGLALWQDGQSDPVRIYPYSASVYTKIDQNMLENRKKSKILHNLRNIWTIISHKWQRITNRFALDFMCPFG